MRSRTSGHGWLLQNILGALKRILKTLKCLNIEVVGRLVQKQEVSPLLKRLNWDLDGSSRHQKGRQRVSVVRSL